jgi:hypothetical protein
MPASPPSSHRLPPLHYTEDALKGGEDLFRRYPARFAVDSADPGLVYHHTDAACNLAACDVRYIRAPDENTSFSNRCLRINVTLGQ